MEPYYNIQQAQEVIELTYQKELEHIEWFGSKAFNFMLNGLFGNVSFKELQEMEYNLKYSLKPEY